MYIKYRYNQNVVKKERQLVCEELIYFFIPTNQNYLYFQRYIYIFTAVAEFAKKTVKTRLIRNHVYIENLKYTRFF